MKRMGNHPYCTGPRREADDGGQELLPGTNRARLCTPETRRRLALAQSDEDKFDVIDAAVLDDSKLSPPLLRRL